jgi:hypothetical protein
VPLFASIQNPPRYCPILESSLPQILRTKKSPAEAGLFYIRRLRRLEPDQPASLSGLW